MASYDERMTSYITHKWCFKRGNCSAANMAKAGFVCTTSTAVICYYCEKELDGWEETDDPWHEHRRHASYCPFLKKYDAQTAPDEFTIRETLLLEKERLLLKLSRKYEESRENIEKAFNDLGKLQAKGKEPKKRKP